MRHILAADNRAALARIAAPSTTLFAFDFDGTLAPFVADPDRARMRPSTHTLLTELAQKRPCAIVSGRARSDVGARFSDVPLAGIVGNHGIEPLDAEARFVDVIARARAALADALDPVAGVTIEDKRFTLAVHYRHAPDRAEARQLIHDEVRRVRGVRVVGGELVVNVVPADAPHKGHGLVALVRALTLGAALYIGDDETDEDVFRLAATTHAPEILTIRVGYSTTTKAQFFLEHQDEIDLLLAALLALSRT